jgi:hypothetical protein
MKTPYLFYKEIHDCKATSNQECKIEMDEFVPLPIGRSKKNHSTEKCKHFGCKGAQ